jgi:hypothetical protein
MVLKSNGYGVRKGKGDAHPPPPPAPRMCAYSSRVTVMVLASGDYGAREERLW